ncbi:MAG: DUF4214 domain-containing protein [Proteobacteria bacterium]|nr:DUF4214 domain-containing protein [Pseudomonadota bacterium]
MAITAAMKTSVTQLYAALFNRAPDSDGLGYWVQQIDGGQTLAQVAKAMYDTAPARTYYPLWYSNDEIASQMYSNLLGRTADTGGKAYWSGQLATKGVGTVLTDFLTAVVNYTSTPTAPGYDAALDALAIDSKALFTNKVAVGEYFSQTLRSNDLTLAASALATVTKDPASVDTTNTTIAASVAAASAQTFNLTTDADSMTGGAGNDSFVATLPYLSAGTGLDTTATLTAGDILNGGSGTDTLKIAVSGSNLPATATATATPNLTNIEKVLVSNVASEVSATDYQTIDLSLAGAAVTDVGTSASTVAGVLTRFTNVATIGNVEMAGKGDLTVNYTTTTGLTDALTLTLNGAGTSATAPSTFTSAGIETFNLVAGNAGSFVKLGTDTNLTTVNISGSNAVNVDLNGATNTAITKVSAATATGAITVNASGLTLSALTVTGGTGTTDTFATDSAISASSKLAAITGFETLALTGATTTTLNAAITTGISTFDLTNAANSSLAFAVGYTGTPTIWLTGDAGDTVTDAANAALTVNANVADVTTGTTLTAGTGTDVLNLTADGVGATLTSVSGFETINILPNATTPSTATATITTVDGNVDADKTLSVNASALTNSSAKLTFVGSAEADGNFSITGGAGNDSIVGGAGNDTILGGAGDDSITGGASADSISGGDGADTIYMAGNLTSADTIDGGSGTDVLNLTSFTAGSMAHVTNIETVQFAGTQSISLSAPISTETVTMDLTDTNAQALTLATGYTGATTVKIGITTADTVTNTANVDLTVSGTAAAFNGFTMTPGTGTDTLKITANATSASLSNVATGVETITAVAASTASTVLALTGVIGVASGKTQTINASALTDSAATFGLTTGAAVANSNMVITGATTAVNTINWSLSSANTSVTGGSGDDVLTAGLKVDSINAGAGNDTITMGGNLTFDDTIDGGSGTDTLSVSASVGTSGEFAHVTNIETLKETGANTTVSLSSSSPALTTVDLTATTVQTLTINPGFATAIAVKVTGAGAAQDIITNTAGVAMTVSGKTADISLDSITGGTGTDTINITADGTTAALTLVTKVEQINIKPGTLGSEVTVLSAVDTNVASGKTMAVDASLLNNTSATLNFEGHLGLSTGLLSSTGGAGADTLVGGAGADTIAGGGGANTIDGGGGIDVMSGGAGATTYLYHGVSTDTGIISPAVVYYGGVVAPGTSTSTAGFDTITNFKVGDTITGQFSSSGTAPDIAASSNAVGSIWNSTSGVLGGTYNAATQTFTFASSGGTDTLYVYDLDNNSGTTSTSDLHAILLVGYTAGAASSGSTGLIGTA